MSVKHTLLTSLIAAGSVPAFAAGLACNSDSIDALEGASLTGIGHGLHDPAGFGEPSAGGL